MSNISWNSFGVTHVGKKRRTNQDDFLNLPNNQLWVVADGMGGHQSGELASKSIVKSLNQIEPGPHLGSTVKRIVLELKKVNQYLVDMAGGEDDIIIGSTVVILLACNHYCVYLWSGDSRIYLFRNGVLKQLSYDHNNENRLRAEGYSITEIEANQFSQVLTHAIGGEENLYLDAQIQEIRHEDIFLLCSDGLNKEISDAEIESILQNISIEESLNQLLSLSLEREARDNITIILAQAFISEFNSVATTQRHSAGI